MENGKRYDYDGRRWRVEHSAWHGMVRLRAEDDKPENAGELTGGADEIVRSALYVRLWMTPVD